jgi:hypothetical protein
MNIIFFITISPILLPYPSIEMLESVSTITQHGTYDKYLYYAADSYRILCYYGDEGQFTVNS